MRVDAGGTAEGIDVNCVLNPPFSISGRVVTSDGKPGTMAGAGVRSIVPFGIVRGSRFFIGGDTSKPDDPDAFWIGGLPSGRYELTAAGGSQQHRRMGADRGDARRSRRDRPRPDAREGHDRNRDASCFAHIAARRFRIRRRSRSRLPARPTPSRASASSLSRRCHRTSRSRPRIYGPAATACRFACPTRAREHLVDRIDRDRGRP